MRQFIQIIAEAEKLDEIELIPDFDDEIVGHRLLHVHSELADKATRISELGDLELSKIDQADHVTTFFLRNSWGMLVGKATVVTKEGTPFSYSRISHIWFDPGIRGQGYGYKFYVYLLEHGYDLAPDSEQTRFAKGVWSKLAKNGYVRALSNGKISGVIHNIDQFYSNGGSRINPQLIAVNPASIRD